MLLLHASFTSIYQLLRFWWITRRTQREKTSLWLLWTAFHSHWNTFFAPLFDNVRKKLANFGFHFVFFSFLIANKRNLYAVRCLSHYLVESKLSVCMSWTFSHLFSYRSDTVALQPMEVIDLFAWNYGLRVNACIDFFCLHRTKKISLNRQFINPTNSPHSEWMNKK